MAPGCYLGCASWSLPRDVQERFPGPGQHLQRYASQFPAVEINSSFHRPHSRSTYERWAASVPATFRFSVKLPKAITHERRLIDVQPLLDDFFAQAGGLRERLGCLLVQLPPSLGFDEHAAAAFLASLRERWQGPVAAEPRHASWFQPQVDAFLAQRRIARVLADPVLHAGGERPGGFAGLAYLRLHGRPRTYYSSYDDATLAALAQRIGRARGEHQALWCIFDNTAAGAAAHNALALQQFLSEEPA